MILLVEDNTSIAWNIQQYLELHDFVVEVCHSWTEWLKLAKEKVYDCIILDVMLPGTDGFSILAEIRETKQVPVIMTTAKWLIDDKQHGFDSWADDYLVKPFELKELLMRIQALLKRTQISDIVTFKGITINTEDNEIIKEWNEVKLTNKERLILSCLLDQQGHPTSRSDIVEFVRWWDSLRENDAKLDVYISNLRKKIDKELIETVKGFWYKIRKL